MRSAPELFAGPAHPADAARRDADHQRVGRDIARHDGAGADEGVFADRDAADDRGVGADGGAAPDQRLAKFVLALTAARGLITLVKTQLGPQKTSVFELDAFVERRRCSGSCSRRRCVTFGPTMTFWPSTTFAADRGAGQHMDEMPDLACRRRSRRRRRR